MDPGILAVWNDCAPEGEAEYERWYMGEHLPERVGVPGFRFGRRYEAVSAAPRYFTFYETDTAEVLASPDYVARLGNPTAWTQRVMPSFRNMNRTVCRKMESFGAGLIGGHVVTVRLPERPDDTRAFWFRDTLLGEIKSRPGVVAGQFWLAVDLEVPALAAETRLRGRADDSISGALVIETVHAGEASEVRGALLDALDGRNIDGEAEIGIYRFLCQLAK